MAKVVMDVTMSLDGFITGPNVRAEEPMGDGGEDLHTWMGGSDPVDVEVFEEVNAAFGAIVIGRRTFDLGLKNWGGTPWPGTPSFVVTHRPRPDFVGDNGGAFSFDSLESAVERARQAAGDRTVLVMGGDVARNVRKAGLMNELWIHVAPMLLGGGTPLFDREQGELVPARKTVSGSATHMWYRIPKA
jgi:dihydrofolate reductase